MIAIQNLGVDAAGNTYVALETTHGAATIDVITYIRTYSADGKLRCQINDIPGEHFIHPRDEFRIRNGLGYHLQPMQTRLRIDIWNTK